MLRLPLSWASSCLLGSTVLLFAPTAAQGQCPFDWLPGQGPPGVDGQVLAVTTWDADGPGPSPELLVVGGRLSVAGDVLASGIAAWDGTVWQPLGSGMSGLSGGPLTPYVRALTVYNGELIAGGDFTTAGGVSANRIARWDGSSWQSLGSGMNNRVHALTVYNGELIAGGDFGAAGGVSANHIARWNGSAWQPLGSGLSGAVLSLVVFNGDAHRRRHVAHSWDSL